MFWNLTQSESDCLFIALVTRVFTLLMTDLLVYINCVVLKRSLNVQINHHRWLYKGFKRVIYLYVLGNFK